MTPLKRVARASAALGAILLLGTVGYRIIEGVPWVDGFYMVVITITTVGFEEVFPLSTAGRLFTIFILISGIGLFIYTAGAGVEAVIDRFSDRGVRIRMERKIASVSKHTIVCGFGRVGSSTWRHLDSRQTPVVVIDSEVERIQRARQLGALVVDGDATQNATLIRAGIERAEALIACVHNDSDNLVIVLSARALRPDLLLISRASTDEVVEKLHMAGADKVVTPQSVGARRMAAMALQPELADFLDLVVDGTLVEFQVKRVEVSPDSALVGQTLKEAQIREVSGALVVALEGPEHGALRLNPSPNAAITAGQVLVAIGTDPQIEALADLAGLAARS